MTFKFWLPAASFLLCVVLLGTAESGDSEQTTDSAKQMTQNRAKLRELLGADEIVFIKRYPYTSSHYYTEYLPPRTLGSHNSLLIAMLAPDKVQFSGDRDRLARLLESHKDVHLTPEELLKISNWVDTNAQYYGSYYGRRNLKDHNHPNFRPIPTWQSTLGTSPLPDDQR